MKTAVEWMEEELSTLLPLKEGLTVTDYLIKRKYIIEQAKEMEKSQMQLFYTRGVDDLYNDFYHSESFEKHYNETFKSE